MAYYASSSPSQPYYSYPHTAKGGGEGRFELDEETRGRTTQPSFSYTSSVSTSYGGGPQLVYYESHEEDEGSNESEDLICQFFPLSRAHLPPPRFVWDVSFAHPRLRTPPSLLVSQSKWIKMSPQTSTRPTSPLQRPLLHRRRTPSPSLVNRPPTSRLGRTSKPFLLLPPNRTSPPHCSKASTERPLRPTRASPTCW